MINFKRHKEFVFGVNEKYTKKFSQSGKLYSAGQRFFPNGVSQQGRYSDPFPVYFKSGTGSKLRSVDGPELIDFWGGHFCNVFGNSPHAVQVDLLAAMNNNNFLQSGVLTDLEGEVADLILAATGGEQVLFSISGASVTMQAIMMASALTGRKKIVKIQGGWHGVHPWVMGGVKKGPQAHGGIVEQECGGIPEWFEGNVIPVPLNDEDYLRSVFSVHGSEIAGCIAELVIGNAGMVMAKPSFVELIRELCSKNASVMILDELVTGFRTRPGGLQKTFGIEADLTTYGKAISGGMPFACIVGKEEFMRSSSTAFKDRVISDAGTFTAHPGTLVAVRATLREFATLGEQGFVAFNRKAAAYRKSIIKLFETNSVSVDVTGSSTLNDLESFPIFTTRFIKNAAAYNARSDALVHWDDEICDIGFRNEVSRKALALRGLFSWQGGGVVTHAHTEEELNLGLEAYEILAKEVEGVFPLTRKVQTQDVE